MNQQMFFLVASGCLGGFLFNVLKIPGGCMLGAVVGSMLVKLLGFSSLTMPGFFYNAAQIALGICVGAMLSTDLLMQIKSQIPVMILSTAILLAAGLFSAIVVKHMTDMDVISSILSTSPGGLNAVIGMADHSSHLPQIMAFQMIRLYTVILLVPVFCWVMRFFFHR